MKKTSLSVGIIGLGYVGGATYNWFKNKKHLKKVFLYDKYKKIGSIAEVNKADVIFIAVPTPYIKEKGYDDSAVRESVAAIANRKIVVIKSTVMPGSTAKFQKIHPHKTILFNPEFLRAKTAKEDFLNPDRQLVGYANAKGKLAARKILDILPNAQFKKILKSSEAEMVKYFGNAFLASRVIFANQIYDICKASGIDYEVVRESASQDLRVGSSHFDVLHDGYRGYGGPCLPKDVRALTQFAKSVHAEHELLLALEKINEKLNSQKTS